MSRSPITPFTSHVLIYSTIAVPLNVVGIVRTTVVLELIAWYLLLRAGKESMIKWCSIKSYGHSNLKASGRKPVIATIVLEFFSGLKHCGLLTFSDIHDCCDFLFCVYN